MLTQYAFSILFIDKKKAKFSNDRFGFIAFMENPEKTWTDFLATKIQKATPKPSLFD